MEELRVYAVAGSSDGGMSTLGLLGHVTWKQMVVSKF